MFCCSAALLLSNIVLSTPTLFLAGFDELFMLVDQAHKKIIAFDESR